MSEQISSQPPDHEPEAQLAADEPQADDPADEPTAEAGKPEPETPKPSSEQRGRPESRFSVLTALISAAAALIGATVGGIASYMAAQSQAAAQFQVAQTNNSATADQALITRRQTAYSDFIAAEDDLEEVELRFHIVIGDFKPPDTDPVNAAFALWVDAHNKWLHLEAMVGLVDSPEVNHSLKAIVTQENELQETITVFMKQAVDEMTTVDQSALDQFFTKVDGLTELNTKFLTAAKRDISG